MQFLFTPVDSQDHDTGMFTADNGNQYYMSVEFGTNTAGTDEFVIHDTVGRYMPIPADIETIDALMDILETIRGYKEHEEAMDLMTEAVMSTKQVEPEGAQ